jgi:hypothetical protein
VPADWPDESDGHPDRRDDNSAASRPIRPSRPESGPPSRQEEYVNLRIAVSTEQAKAAHQITAAERAAAEKWDKNAAESRSLWTEYERRWPEAAHLSTHRFKDSLGTSLAQATYDRLEAVCDRIENLEQDRISPALRLIESQDPDRRLVGFDERLKDRDRIIEKVYGTYVALDRTPDQAISLIPDVIRYTFEYREDCYTQGVWADIARLRAQGFELNKLKNMWADEQYKGINSQWTDPDSGQLFEVQFHTRISFEAKQLTHGAYERLQKRQSYKPDRFEQMVLEAFQKKVASEVPIPYGSTDILDYP